MKKSGQLFIWTLARSPEGCDTRCDVPVIWWGGGLSDRLFGQNNPFLFCFNIVYVCFVGNVAVSVWLAYVWLIISCDYSDWIGLSLWMPIGCYGLYGPYLYDYHLYYPTHQCVIINSNQWECLAIRVCTWVCTSLHTKLFFLFLFITQICLIVFFYGQINHLYDV